MKYRIVTNGRVFKVQFRVFFFLWLTALKDTLPNSGMKLQKYQQAIFRTLKEAEEFIEDENDNATRNVWKTVEKK